MKVGEVKLIFRRSRVDFQSPGVKESLTFMWKYMSVAGGSWVGSSGIKPELRAEDSCEELQILRVKGTSEEL